MNREEVLTLLNANTAEERLENLRLLIEQEDEKPEERPQYANSHIHTFYSFSPYSPTAAVWFAREAGLTTAGIMDHDSIAGADEFEEAGRIAAVATTSGMECRVSLEGTPFAERKLNNPDQDGIAYMAIHGVRREGRVKLQDYFAPLREHRNVRNRRMVEKINSIVSPHGVELDFDRDVIPISQYENGGSVTERHLLYALGEKIFEVVGSEELVHFLEQVLRINLADKQRTLLSDPSNPHLKYDLLGVLKAELVEQIYIPATEECITLAELVELGREVNAIVCYAYLGDVGESVTGDKKTAKFEDDYLEELLDELKRNGVAGVTYMPSRNSESQLDRLQKLCRERGFIEISGEDINSPRQGFICEQLAKPQFSHLIDATWRLIEHER
jgi:predicted metal-dependent phosphoesterase TrpH